MNWIDSIKNYKPYNEQEKKDKEIILKCMSIIQNLLTRENEIAHITSSAFVVNKERNKVLLVHHNIFNSWALPGGHADGEEDLLAVAIKETVEETGVKNILPISSGVFALDVLPVLGHIKRGMYVTAHLHFSIVYLLQANERDVLKIKEDENSDVRWIPIEQVVPSSSEPHMKKVYSKLISKVKDYDV